MIMNYVSDSIVVLVLIPVTCRFCLWKAVRGLRKEGRKEGRKETRTPINSNFILEFNAYSVV